MSIYQRKGKRKPRMGFFKAFNSLQITGLFAAFPFGLMWLWAATFPGAAALFWILAIVYFIFFLLMTGAVFSAVDHM